MNHLPPEELNGISPLAVTMSSALSMYVDIATHIDKQVYMLGANFLSLTSPTDSIVIRFQNMWLLY